MNKKVVVLGGGTGMSNLLRGLKQFPLDITAVVTVSDDGKSTGRLREEFNTPAVGDIRRVIVALSETEPLFQDLMNYRFKTSSDLNDHALGNLLLTGLVDVAGSMSCGIESLSKVLNLKGKVLPLTNDNIVLMGKMSDGSIICGEHNITDNENSIEEVFYQTDPEILPDVLTEIEKADLIILSMGSLYTSIIPNLISKDLIKSIDKSNAKLMYVCNMMTQPGETDNYTASKHIKVLNSYLGKKKIDVIVVNSGSISKELKEKYANLEQKDPVIVDVDELKKIPIDIVNDDFITIDDGTIKHNTTKLGFHIFSYLIL